MTLMVHSWHPEKKTTDQVLLLLCRSLLRPGQLSSLCTSRSRSYRVTREGRVSADLQNPVSLWAARAACPWGGHQKTSSRRPCRSTSELDQLPSMTEGINTSRTRPHNLFPRPMPGPALPLCTAMELVRRHKGTQPSSEQGVKQMRPKRNRLRCYRDVTCKMSSPRIEEVTRRRIVFSKCQRLPKQQCPPSCRLLTLETGEKSNARHCRSTDCSPQSPSPPDRPVRQSRATERAGTRAWQLCTASPTMVSEPATARSP